jgi:hypothetical protein
MKRLLVLALACASLSGLGCDEGRAPDAGVPDMAISDLSISDMAISDLSIPDLSLPDLSTPDLSLPDLASVVLVPHIDDPWWVIASTPDLGALNGPGQQPVDFNVWQASDGTWQLWGCIRGTHCGGATRLFYHWQGAQLTDSDWQPMGIAMQADPSLGETPGGLQAPFVLFALGEYHMFYGDWEHICQAVSTDGVTFDRLVTDGGVTGMFDEGEENSTRDPMVLPINGRYYAYYSANPNGLDSVYCRTSDDLLTWSASTLVSGGGTSGWTESSSECPFVVYRADTGYYYLFRTQQYGQYPQTRVYRSRDPLAFGVGDDSHLVALLPVAAPEIVDVGGETYIAALTLGLDGYRVAHLSWVPASP